MAQPDSPLDRVTWSALTGRHSSIAMIHGRARRYHPLFGVFAALEDHSDSSLADLASLVREQGDVALLEADPPAVGPGLAIHSQDLGVQMIATSLNDRPRTGAAITRLGNDDAAEMVDLAALTQPGPFFQRTNELGDFYGIRIDGRLVAMAGERMKPAGHTEVSGVCTHPDHRGAGLAGALMTHVGQNILQRGETAFLHAYASNRQAIALYEHLGFAVRKEILMTRFTASPS